MELIPEAQILKGKIHEKSTQNKNNYVVQDFKKHFLYIYTLFYITLILLE